MFAAGGLGNQLFQLAAGYSIQAGREVVCEVGFSGPRKKLHSADVLSHVSLEERISIISSKQFTYVTQRCLDYLLRVSTKTKGLESSVIYRTILLIIGSLYFSFYYKCFLLLSLAKGVGYCHLPKYKSNQMIIGYFQSYKYLDEEKKESFLRMLSLRETGPDWTNWSNRAIQEKPTIVHIRLGDYLMEDGFGIITTKYISESLTQLSMSSNERPVWVLTDQKDLAEEILPHSFLKDAVWVPEIDSNPMATLSIMRLGSGYVISNSTFSWWAAWSRQFTEAAVYCPHPWFLKSEIPLDLIPIDWNQIDTK